MTSSDEAASRASGSRSHRTRNLLIDVGVVVVLAAHLVVFVMIRNAQAQYTGEAKAIASWAQSKGVSRVAWPAELRSAVPTLLHAGVTPVLVDPSEINAQQLVANDAPVLVTRGEPRGFDDIALARTSAGSLVATLVDLQTASSQPLEFGQSIAVEYSLPYVFTPIEDSHALVVGQPLRIPVTLAPGRYEFSTEVFDPNQHLTLTLSATPDRGARRAHRERLHVLVDEPQVLLFTVAGRVTKSYTLEIRVTPTPGAGSVAEHAAVARMHRWSLERVV